MMGHVGSDGYARLATRQPGCREIDGLHHAIRTKPPGLGEQLQVRTRLLRHHHERHCRSIGSDHQVVGQSALESKAGNSKGPVLEIRMRVDGVVARFGDAPGNAAQLAIGNLGLDRCMTGLIQQRVFVRRHHQRRHQVLKHRSAPGEQKRVSAS